MKALIETFPAWMKVFIYFLIMWLASFIAGIIQLSKRLIKQHVFTLYQEFRLICTVNLALQY
jgi:hypothetical protein